MLRAPPAMYQSLDLDESIPVGLVPCILHAKKKKVEKTSSHLWHRDSEWAPDRVPWLWKSCAAHNVHGRQGPAWLVLI